MNPPSEGRGLSPKPLLVKHDPLHTAPVIRSACPSCGRVAEREAGAWTLRVDGTLIARMSCEGLGEARVCWRTWDDTVSAPARVQSP